MSGIVTDFVLTDGFVDDLSLGQSVLFSERIFDVYTYHDSHGNHVMTEWKYHISVGKQGDDFVGLLHRACRQSFIGKVHRSLTIKVQIDEFGKYCHDIWFQLQVLAHALHLSRESGPRRFNGGLRTKYCIHDMSQHERSTCIRLAITSTGAQSIFLRTPKKSSQWVDEVFLRLENMIA